MSAAARTAPETGRITFDDQLAPIRASKLVHPKWRVRTHPDGTTLGMDPFEHDLRYGAPLGRDPGVQFDAAFHRATYPGVAASGMTPLAPPRRARREKPRPRPTDAARQARRARRTAVR